jgi:hypothetical protein
MEKLLYDEFECCPSEILLPKQRCEACLWKNSPQEKEHCSQCCWAQKIKYESTTVLPSEITELFQIAEKALCEYSREPDKTVIIFDNLRASLTVWFSTQRDMPR